jgi:hypothetical protein
MSRAFLSVVASSGRADRLDHRTFLVERRFLGRGQIHS